MKFVFYNIEPNVNKLAVTTTDKSVDELKAEGVINPDCKGLVVDVNIDKPTDVDDHWSAVIMHINYAKFDNLANPKTVVVDYDLLEFAVAEDVRIIRENLFNQLDVLQMQAMLKNKQDVVAMIEADKQILRDAPAKIYAGDNKSFKALSFSVPDAMYVDFQNKYSELLK